MTPQRRVIVIGAGPAGLAAADAALSRGATTLLLDSGPRLGGQFWRHPDPKVWATDTSLQHNWSRFGALREAIVTHASAEVITDAQVWAIDHAQHRGAPQVRAAIGPADSPDREQLSRTADALIIATGAHDLTLPFPGWELPGVFTAGAAQAMAKAEGVAVGRRVAVAGSGPFLLPVARSLAAVGADVVGVYEAATARRLAQGWLPKAPWLAGRAPELAGYLGGLARRRIPYRLGQAVVRAQGHDAVRSVTIARVDSDWRPIPGTEHEVAADAVCVSHGFTPRLELAVAAGCAITPDRFVTVDAGQRTTVPGVFAAGETTGIGGSDAALIEGRISGHLAAGGGLNDHEIAAAFGARRRLDRLAASITDAHGIGRSWTEWLTEDTTICRCEEVSYGRLRDTLTATGSRGLRAIKLSSRVGLGLCQGRICGRVVDQLITDDDSRPGTDDATIDRRPIAAPIRFGELATLADHQQHQHDRQPEEGRDL